MEFLRPDGDVDFLSAPGEKQRAGLVGDRIGVDDTLLHVAPAGDLVHDFHERLFEDGAEAARAGLVFESGLSDGAEGVVGEDELDAVHLEVALVLLDEGVLRLGENADQCWFVEGLEADNHRQAADELGDEAKFEQVIVGDMRHELILAPGATEATRGLEAKADVVAGEALLDVIFETFEGAATDEEDVRGVDLQEVLVGVLPTALWRDVGDAALDDLEEGLLDAFAGDIARDARVVALGQSCRFRRYR